MRLLVSVRDVDEALDAARAGVDFVDLKEPRGGALGAVALPIVADIVRALRDEAGGFRITATIGDAPGAGVDGVAWALARVRDMAACGVDLVKVGILGRDPAAAMRLLHALAGSGQAIVPVFIVDDGLDAAAFAAACTLDFAAVMLDTADKRRGSLFETLAPADLRRSVAAAHAAGMPIGLAGALGLQHLPTLTALAPSHAGFRSAVCDGDRAGRLDPVRLRALVVAMKTVMKTATTEL